MEMWVAYDAVSGDAAADGTEKRIRQYLERLETGTEGRHTTVIGTEAAWRRDAAVIARRMSGNPPRRSPASIEHL
ncbi:MAG: hypothetical protein ACRDP5_24100 [Streptosporangiaceae bacterium]